ncbi:hypothetical protein LS482_17290 [Sinomicrobium kalidii]|uniref:hypothetical protein n=1 Tax=Sinomicrobium kalidii TaxID=2900738 RepID=UPI001E64B666|nr:hypothetical protein [Sinomicrobium kalidii]UGU15424.1 hypothetical protein LS482_17290 [Sinomicrobium kalidii]
MRFINTQDIENWASTVDCKYHLPHLIRNLILATIDNNAIKNIHFPYGEDVQTGGFDGELITESENMFVPLGESVWEFGTTNNKKAKADEDYEKRKENPLGKIPAQTTYVNVNAKKYRDKNKWVETKQAEGFWKDVKYLDKIDIEQWLELAPTVELWLAEKLRKPTFGIYTVDEYWKCWSENKSIKIVPEILLGDSRSDEIERLKSFVKNGEGTLYIKSITTDEALAFPLAVIKSYGISDGNIVVIDNRESFNQFTHTAKSLTVLVKFKATGTDLSGAIHRGHRVIIPISLSEEVSTSDKIQLSITSRDTFEQSLGEMGIDAEQVKILTKNSGRNISILKRLLQFDNGSVPKYMDGIDTRDILPMLLINRFSENRIGDKEIVEKLSGKTSDEYIRFLKVLANLDDSPIYYISGVWRLISPTDTWLYFAKYITRKDLENFQEVCLNVLGEISHKYTLSKDERKNYYHTPENRTKYSSNLREGICESIVVISVFGDDYGLNSVPNISSYIDNIVQKILEMDTVVWRSLSRNLMLLAEASPSIFLNNLERIIKERSVTAFFEVEERFMHSSNDLAPLLWCLDILAWFPEYLMRVSTALCELILISPESFPTVNTPLNSLKNIYRTWYPQTNTSAENRKQILEYLIKKYPDILYNLLYNLVGTKQGTAFHTPRPKWRLFSELREIRVSEREVYYMRGFCLDNVNVMSKGNVQKILLLIDLLDDMSWDKLDVALNTIEEIHTGSDENERSQIYHKFRKFIGRHKNHPTARWALPTDILSKIENTALKFKSDDVLNESYLFEEHYPDFIEGRKGKNHREHADEIASRRLNFIEMVLDINGINKIIELATTTEYPFIYGNTLAKSDKLSEKDKLTIYKLIETTDSKHLILVKEFIQISENRTNLQTQIKILDDLIKLGLSIQGIVNFLCSLRGSMGLWKFISDMRNKEIEKSYWTSRSGFLYTENKEELFYALDKLQQYKKSITLLNTLGWGLYEHKGNFTSEEVLTVLEKVSLADLNDNSRFEHTFFNNILDFLYSKNDYDIERGAKIEMKFIFLFTRDTYSPAPKNLYKLMSQKPEEYFGILSEVYLPEKEELRKDKLQDVKENPGYQEILKSGWEILDSFNLIPSLQEDGSINYSELKKWIDEVREFAVKNHRVKVTDNCIGKLLAKYPINMRENKGFPTEIYRIIEEINTYEIKIAFETQISNNLGFTSRGAFEGGNIERFRSDYFNLLFEETKFTYPNVSLIFKNLRDRYIDDAKREDDIALLRSLE